MCHSKPASELGPSPGYIKKQVLHEFIVASIKKKILQFKDSFIVIDCFFSEGHEDVEQHLPVTELIKHMVSKRWLHANRDEDVEPNEQLDPILVVIPQRLEVDVGNYIRENAMVNVYYFCGHIATSVKSHDLLKIALNQCKVLLRVRAPDHEQSRNLDRYLQDSLNLTHVGPCKNPP